MVQEDDAVVLRIEELSLLVGQEHLVLEADVRIVDICCEFGDTGVERVFAGFELLFALLDVAVVEEFEALVINILFRCG